MAMLEKTEAEISIELVNRILQGDPSAENEMVARYQRGLQIQLKNRAQDSFVADDITNETWIIVLTKVRNGDLDDKSKLGAFINQIGRFQLLMLFRKNNDRRTEDDSYYDTTPSDELSPEQQLENKQLGLIVKCVIDELATERDRDLLTRLYVIGESKSKVCSELGLSSAHFDRVKFRARQRFMELWNKKVDQGLH